MAGRRNRKRETKLKISRYLIALMAFGGLLQGPPAQSQEAKPGDIVISPAWCRSAPRGAEVANCYMTAENKGAAADRLVGGSADIAEKVELQQISMVGGAMSVNPVSGGLAISPGDKMVLAPGSYFVGLEKLKSKMKKGTKVSITLEFEKAGKIPVDFDVLSAASRGPDVPKAAPDKK
jgi:periplasmic copper chaperone A